MLNTTAVEIEQALSILDESLATVQA